MLLEIFGAHQVSSQSSSISLNSLNRDVVGRKVSMQLLYNENVRPNNEYRGFCAASASQVLPDDCGLFMGRTNNGLHGYDSASI